MKPAKEENAPAIPPIYIVSGGVGASGEQVVHTVLAQFPDHQVPVITVGNIRYVDQLESVVAQAKQSGGTIVHTLVESHLRSAMIHLAKEKGIVDLDLMGPLLARVSELLERQPLGQPGLYRRLRKDYFERVEAIEYTMNHDDGRHPDGWPQADLILLGASRTGKTPLCLYLSVLGWKAANLPLIPGLDTPAELFEVDSHRVIGLTIEPGQLLMHRQQRQSRLGAPGRSVYTDPDRIHEEIQAAKKFYRQNGFSVIDVTDKPIETSADEVIRLITRHNRVG